MAEAIRVDNLVKKYKSSLKTFVNAVDDISFTVEQGEVFGFIGPNGAGKTTTIKILLGLLFPTSGQVEVLGKPVGDIETKYKISYLPESPYFYEHMTGKEVLDFYCNLFRLSGDVKRKRIGELLETVGLSDDGDRPLRSYSKGMLQRIGIAQSLINDPELVFFDEPTSGLDPIAHKDIQDLIARLKDQGKSVFISSHQLSDIEMVCDRVAIINRGKLVRLGTLDELLLAGRIVVTLSGVDEKMQDELATISDRRSVEGHYAKFFVDSEEKVHAILDKSRGHGKLVAISPEKQTLEDLFVEIVREARN